MSVPGSPNYSLDNGAGPPDSLPWCQTICHGGHTDPPPGQSGSLQVRIENGTFLELLQKSHHRGKTGTKDLLSLVWDHVMVNLGCCGGNSYLDFTNSTTWASTRGGMQVRCQMSGDAMPGTHHLFRLCQLPAVS